MVPLVKKIQKLHNDCSYHAMIHYYCPEGSRPQVEVMGNESIESNETSKIMTQGEVSMTSTKSSEGDVEVSSKEGDIIRHFTPHHRVFSHASSGNCR